MQIDIGEIVVEEAKGMEEFKPDSRFGFMAAEMDKLEERIGRLEQKVFVNEHLPEDFRKKLEDYWKKNRPFSQYEGTEEAEQSYWRGRAVD